MDTKHPAVDQLRFLNEMREHILNDIVFSDVPDTKIGYRVTARKANHGPFTTVHAAVRLNGEDIDLTFDVSDMEAMPTDNAFRNRLTPADVKDRAAEKLGQLVLKKIAAQITPELLRRLI